MVWTSTPAKCNIETKAAGIWLKNIQYNNNSNIYFLCFKFMLIILKYFLFFYSEWCCFMLWYCYFFHHCCLLIPMTEISLKSALFCLNIHSQTSLLHQPVVHMWTWLNSLLYHMSCRILNWLHVIKLRTNFVRFCVRPPQDLCKLHTFLLYFPRGC